MHHTQNLLDKNQKKEFLQKKYECMQEVLPAKPKDEKKIA